MATTRSSSTTSTTTVGSSSNKKESFNAIKNRFQNTSTITSDNAAATTTTTKDFRYIPPTMRDRKKPAVLHRTRKGQPQVDDYSDDEPLLDISQHNSNLHVYNAHNHSSYECSNTSDGEFKISFPILKKLLIMSAFLFALKTALSVIYYIVDILLITAVITTGISVFSWWYGGSSRIQDSFVKTVLDKHNAFVKFIYPAIDCYLPFGMLEKKFPKYF